MISRRSFLRVLGVAIVAPVTLLAAKPKPGWYDFKPFPTKADREKYHSKKQTIIWKNYCVTYSPKNKEALDAIRRVSKLHRVIVKQAIQKQKAYGQPH